MITHLNGTICDISPSHATIDVNGMGYNVKISVNTYTKIKDKKKTFLLTHLVVKEDAHILVGFYNEEERATFLELVTIKGISTSIGLMILSSLSPEEIKRAILTNDTQSIQSIKGIGSKTAQRVILELKDKINKLEIDISSKGTSLGDDRKTIKDEAMKALVSLGINKNVAEKNVISLLNSNNDITVEEVIKLALKRP